MVVHHARADARSFAGRVRVGRGGAAQWTARWTLPPTDGGVAIRLTGLPAGMSVRSSPAPSFLEADRSTPVERCEAADTAVVCSVGTPRSTAYEQNSSLLLSAGTGTPVGRHEVQAELLSGGSAVATTSLDVVVRGSAVHDLLLARTGDQLVTAGQTAQQQLHVLLLAGPRAGRRTVRVKQPVASKLRSVAVSQGESWNCRATDCRWRGRVRVGASAPPLTSIVRPTAQLVRSLPSAKGSKAREVWWNSSVTMSARGHMADARLRQMLALAPAPSSKQPKDPPSRKILDRARRPMMDARVVTMAQPRVGGMGRYRIHVNNGGARPARGVRVQVALPRQAARAKYRLPGGWRRSGSSLLWRKPVASHAALPPVDVIVTGRSSAVRGANAQRLRATASWRGRGWADRTSDTGRSAGNWLRPLRVAASKTNAHVTGESGVTTTLSARLRNLAGQKHAYSFRQICSNKSVRPGQTASCPKVSFPVTRRGESTSDVVTTSFTPPKITKPTRLRFAVQVTANGAVVRDTVSVRALPSLGEDAQWDPRVASTQLPTAAAAEKALNTKPGGYQQSQANPMARMWINSRNPISVYTKKTVTLRANYRLLRASKVAGVKGVRWVVDGKKVSQLKGARLKKKGKVLQFRPTAGQRKRRLIANATLRHRSGAVTVNAEQVIAGTPKRAAASSAAATTRALAAADVAATAGTSFCSLFASLTDDSPLVLGGVTMTLGTVEVSDSDCTDADAEVTFTGGSVSMDGVAFTGLSGSLDAQGLTLDVGEVTLPGSADGLTLSNIQLAATFSSSGLSGLSGSVTIEGFPYLQVPGGWEPTSVTLSVSSAGEVSADFTATGPNSGSATISGDFDDESFTLSITGTNVLTIYGAEGTTATFSGSASISVAKGSTGWTVNFSGSASLNGGTTGLELFDNVSLESASISFSNAGLQLSAAAQMAIGSDTLSLQISASIDSDLDWTAEISTQDQVAVNGLNLSFSGSGSLTYTAASGSTPGTLTFSLQADVSVAEVSQLLGFEVATVEASLASGCPSTGSTASCSKDNVQLSLAVTGTYQLWTQAISVDTTVFVDPATGDWAFSVSVVGSNFGPAEAQLDQVSFFATNDASPSPSATSTPSSATLPAITDLANSPCWTDQVGTSGLVLGFTAKATFLDDIVIDVVGIYQDSAGGAPNEYCMYGLAAATNNDLDDLGMGSQVGFVYASYQVTVADDNLIAPNSPTVWGTYNLSPSQQAAIDNTVTGFTALATLQMSNGAPTGFAVQGQIDTSIYIFGSSAGDSVSLEIASLGVKSTVSLGEATGTEDELYSSANFSTPAGSGNGITASTISMTLSIGVDVSDEGGLGLVVSANLDSPVTDAFGVSGLGLDQFTVQGNISYVPPEEATWDIDLNAAATLPGSITDPIGMVAGTKVSFTLAVGDDDPCLAFTIGSTQDTVSVINWGNLIEADYLNMVIAPEGNCTFDGVNYTDTFSFDFDGTVLGTAADVNVAFELGTAGFSMDADVYIASFNLSGMAIESTVLELNVQPGSQDMTVTFSGGANIFGEVIVYVSGNLTVSLSATNPSLNMQLTGTEDANLLGVFQEDASFTMTADLGIQNGVFSVSTLDFSVSANVNLLIFSGGGSLDFNYSDGAVQSISGNANVGVNLFIVKASLSASFSYTEGDPDITVGLDGSMTVGFWIFSHTFTASFTVDIPSGQLTTSEFTPPPPSTIPVAATPSSNTWSGNYNFYQGFDFNLSQSRNGVQSGLDLLYSMAGGLSSSDLATVGWNAQWATQNPSPMTGEAPLTGGFPSGYDSYLGSWYDNLDVSATVTGTSMTAGQATSGSDSTSNVEVTLTLPQSPLVQYLNTANGGAPVFNGTEVSASNPEPVISCPAVTTKTVTVDVPSSVAALDQSDDAVNWAWIMMDINFRMYLASVQEKALALNMWDRPGGNLPNGAIWGANSDFTMTWTNYGPVLPTPDFDCGWDVFDDPDVGLNSFLSESEVPIYQPSFQPTWSTGSGLFGQTDLSIDSLMPNWNGGIPDIPGTLGLDVPNPVAYDLGVTWCSENNEVTIEQSSWSVFVANECQPTETFSLPQAQSTVQQGFEDAGWQLAGVWVPDQTGSNASFNGPTGAYSVDVGFYELGGGEIGMSFTINFA